MSRDETDGLLLVSEWLGGGGIERNMETIAVHLHRRGRRVALASWGIRPQISGRPNPVLFRLAAVGIPVFNLTAQSPFSLSRLGWRLAHLARHWGASALCGKEVSAALAAVLAKLCSGGRLWVTAEFHNSADIYARTGLSRGHRQLARWLLPRADRRLAVSAATRHDAAAFFGLRPESIAVVFNPMELPPGPAAGELAPLSAEPLEIIACGRLKPMKGFDILLRALARVRPARDARLMVLGEGPLHASLAALAGQLGLAGVVSWRGQVPDPRVFFRRARMLVSASVFGESWGLAMAEAMSCGTPVIATRIGGVEELLGFGRYGTLVASGDPAALADSMAAVWDHPAQARRRAAAARAWVRQFAADRIVPQLEAHYWPVSPLAPAAPVPWLPEFAVSGGPEGSATPHCGMGGAIDVA